MATQGKTPAMGGLWVAVNFYIDRQSGTTAWVKECKMLRSSCLLIYDVDTTSHNSHLYLLEWMFQISDATPQLCMHAHTQAFDIDPRRLFGRAGRLRLSGELGSVSLIPTGSILLRATQGHATSISGRPGLPSELGLSDEISWCRCYLSHKGRSRQPHAPHPSIQLNCCRIDIKPGLSLSAVCNPDRSTPASFASIWRMFV